MKDLLFLVHRIPYPPNKGDKIVSYNMLRYLCGRYRVHLGAFVDDPQDFPHIKTVTRMVQGEAHIVPLNSLRARLLSIVGLVSGEALTVRYYRNRAFQGWVDRIIAEHKIRRIVAFSGAMAQFVAKHRGLEMRRVVDFVDVDSDKWRQYSLSQTWPMSWVYRREGRLLLDFEKRMAREAEYSAFISPFEADLFQSLAPDVARKVTAIDIGVDQQYYDPEREYPNPYPSVSEVLVFTGAMDYWANVDAVDWFAREVFPLIRNERPNACFYIVGSRPVPKVKALSSLPAVHVTGRVEDIRPYLAHSRMAVAPMRIARGIQNKVLEAMSMAKPVLVTQAGMEGIRHCPSHEGLICQNAAELAERALQLLAAEDLDRIGSEARRFVSEHYDWNRNLDRLAELLEHGAMP